MKEFIEKLICRLEEIKNQKANLLQFQDRDFFRYSYELRFLEEIKDIINELAEEYINTSTDTSSGWIPCSERLPEKNQRCLVSYKGNINSEGIEEKYVDIDRFEGTRFSFFGIDRVIAWQSLPAPYKEGVRR